MLLIKLKYLWYLLDNSNTGASVYMLNSCLKLNFSVWHLVDVTSVTWWIGFCRGGGFWNFSRYNTAFTLFFFCLTKILTIKRKHGIYIWIYILSIFKMKSNIWKRISNNVFWENIHAFQFSVLLKLWDATSIYNLTYSTSLECIDMVSEIHDL